MLAVLALPLELLKSFKIAVVLSAFSGDNPGFGRGNLADSGLKGQESAKLPALGTAIGRRERRLPGGNANQSAKRFGSGGRESGLLPLDRSVRPRGLGRALYRGLSDGTGASNSLGALLGGWHGIQAGPPEQAPFQGAERGFKPVQFR